MRSTSINATIPNSFEFLADQLLFKLQVTLSADKAAVDSVVQRIMESVREKDCAQGKENEIELALSEALANAVVHGAKSDPSKVVECDVACDENRSLLIVVRDPGNGFDPATIPSPIRERTFIPGTAAAFI